MGHERSRTSQGTPFATPPPGGWVNTYGPGTLYEGQPLPGMPTYPDVGTADAAAALRSIMQNTSPAQAQERALPVGPAAPVVQPPKPQGWGEWLKGKVRSANEEELRQSNTYRNFAQATGMPGSQPMRFDAGGQTTPLIERGGAPPNQYDLDQMERMGGVAGATKYAPRHIYDTFLLDKLNDARRMAPEDLSILRAKVRNIPQEQVDLTKAESIFGHGPGNLQGEVKVKQRVKDPSGQTHELAEWDYEPDTNYIQFLRTNPELRPNLKEQDRLMPQALEYLKKTFGHTAPPGYFPISDSRARLFQRWGGEQPIVSEGGAGRKGRRLSKETPVP